MDKRLILLLIIGIVFISGCDVYDTLYGEQEDEDMKPILATERLDILKYLEEEHNFEVECVEKETNEVQQKMYDDEFPFCSDICEISYFCREFMDEHNINTSGIPYLPKHIRNAILVTPDFCNFNAEDDREKCMESCLDNYYEDELYRTINETTCTKEVLVRNLE